MIVYKNFDMIGRDLEPVFTVKTHGVEYEQYEYYLPEGLECYEGKCGDILVEDEVGNVRILNKVLENIGGYPAICYYDGTYHTCFLERSFRNFADVKLYKTISDGIKHKTVRNEISMDDIWENDGGEWDWADMIVCTAGYDNELPYIYMDSKNSVISPDGEILFRLKDREKEEGLFV